MCHFRPNSCWSINSEHDDSVTRYDSECQSLKEKRNLKVKTIMSASVLMPQQKCLCFLKKSHYLPMIAYFTDAHSVQHVDSQIIMMMTLQWACSLQWKKYVTQIHLNDSLCVLIFIIKCVCRGGTSLIMPTWMAPVRSEMLRFLPCVELLERC